MYLLLLLLWFIFNGRVTLEVALFGIVICGWLYWFICKYMGYSFQREKVLVKKIPLYLKYQPKLVEGMIDPIFHYAAGDDWKFPYAPLDVIKIIFSPKKAEIQPALVRFHTDLKSEASLVALANSITLTPGTYTVELENGEYVVQALDREKFGEGLEDSVFVKQLRRLEG